MSVHTPFAKYWTHIVKKERDIIPAKNSVDNYILVMRCFRVGYREISHEGLDCVNCVNVRQCSHYTRLRVVPHFSSGIVERAKRERA